jgi:chromosome segregation ATPase
MLLTAVQQLQDMESQKEILLNQQVKYNQELQEWTQELRHGNQWLRKQLETANNSYQELQKWTQELQKGKGWLEQQLKSTQKGKDWLEQQLKSNQKGKDWLEQQLKSTKEQLESTNQNLDSKTEQLEYVQAEIEGMKSSKFWKLRQKWSSLKKRLGFPTNE